MAAALSHPVDRHDELGIKASDTTIPFVKKKKRKQKRKQTYIGISKSAAEWGI